MEVKEKKTKICHVKNNLILLDHMANDMASDMANDMAKWYGKWS